MPLKVHFLNVGRGDCTIIEFPSGRIGIVDIDNLKSLDPSTKEEIEKDAISGPYGGDALLEALKQLMAVQSAEEDITDPFEYYQAWIGNRDIFRMIVTHPDMDHMTGLKRLAAERSILNFWHIGPYDFNLTGAEWDGSPYDEDDWQVYKKLRASVSDPKALKMMRNATGSFWSEDQIQLWAPTQGLLEKADRTEQANISSMVLRISYRGRAIILGGDATAEDSWPAIYPATDMTGIDVLKASHHGRKSGYHQPSVKEMSPWLTITSVWDKDYDATELYRRYSDYTVSLRQCGDVQITIEDDGKLIYSPNIQAHWKPKTS
jgi:beta-lactamase superfamily II metal-dependent hydrolase